MAPAASTAHAARSRPAAPLASPGSRPSVRSIATIRRREAPSARRTAISRRRRPACARNRPITLVHATSSTSPATDSSSVRTRPTSDRLAGSTRASRSDSAEKRRGRPLASVQWSGCAARSRVSSTASCAARSSSVAPSRSRPITRSSRLPRAARSAGGISGVPPSTPSGIQISGRRPKKRLVRPAGATPTMVKSCPLSPSVRPTTSGSDSNRRCHRSWLTIRTCAARPTSDSSGRNERPSAGAMPATAK